MGHFIDVVPFKNFIIQDAFKQEYSAYKIYYNDNYIFENTKITLTNEGNILICNISNEMFYINEKNVWNSFVSKVSKKISLKRYALQAYLKEKSIEKAFAAKSKVE